MLYTGCGESLFREKSSGAAPVDLLFQQCFQLCQDKLIQFTTISRQSWELSREMPCPMPRKMHQMVQQEPQTMSMLEAIEELHKDQRSLSILPPSWLCTDFRKIISISEFDTYMMNKLDELLGE